MHRSQWVAATVLAALVVGGCSASEPTTGPTSSSPTHLAGTEEYLPGLAADVYLPTDPVGASVVVLVPGGTWQSADRTGLGPLADALADRGIVAVTATYRTGTDESRFPVPVEDIVCAVGFAQARANEVGASGPLVLLGHSAGAHLAAVAALVPERFQGQCSSAPAAPDALVGLAGPYDVESSADVAWPLIGSTPEEDPKAWEEANPLTWAASRTELPVLLAHGDADDVVPLELTNQFVDALRDEGHEVRMELVPDADHDAIYGAQMAALVADWIDSLGG